MAKQTVNLGVAPDGVGGDSVRSGFTKINANMDELYTLPSQAEAEGGIVSVVRGWSALRVRQAILAAFKQFGYGGQNPLNLELNCNDLPAGSRNSWTDSISESTAVSLNLPALGGSSSDPRSWHVECFGIGSSRLIQEATEVFGAGTTRGRTFTRVKHDSTWYPWVEVMRAGEWVDLRPHLKAGFYFDTARASRNSHPRIRKLSCGRVELDGVVTFNETSGQLPFGVFVNVPSEFRPTLTAGGLMFGDTATPLSFGAVNWIVTGVDEYSPPQVHGDIMMIPLTLVSPSQGGALSLNGIYWFT